MRDRPRSGFSRDRALRYLLGGRALNVPLPDVYLAGPQSLYALAQASEVTFSWVHKIVKELETRGWVKTGKRLEIRDPQAIYEWWASIRKVPDVASYHVRDPRAAGNALRELGVPTAFTTYYAENAYQGHLFPRRGDVYIQESDVAKAKRVLVEELDAQIGGTNFRLLVADDHLLTETISIGKGKARADYAPIPQVILDLVTEGGSAREAADMLIQKVHPHAKPRLQ